MGALPSTLETCGINSEQVATAFHDSVVSFLDSGMERVSSSTDSSITISTVESSRTSASST
jgi:hypothetical protein